MHTVLCFVVVMQSFIMNSHEVFIHIHQGCFAGTWVIVRLPQCQWSKPDGYGKISQCITTTKHSKAKTMCIFLGIYCRCLVRSGMLWLRSPLLNKGYQEHLFTTQGSNAYVCTEYTGLMGHVKLFVRQAGPSLYTFYFWSSPYTVHCLTCSCTDTQFAINGGSFVWTTTSYLHC